jgi:hypothetical protein
MEPPVAPGGTTADDAGVEDPWLTSAEQLADGVRRRPGMFILQGAPPMTIWSYRAATAARLGATNVSLTLLDDGLLSFREEGASDVADVSAEWRESVDDPRAAVVSKSAELHVIRAVSTQFDVAFTSTTSEVRFRPDPGLFAPLPSFAVAGYLRDLATAFPHLTVAIDDRVSGQRLVARYARGSLDRLHEEGAACSFNQAPVRVIGSDAGVSFDVALAWHWGPGLQLVALANGQRTPNGGTHVQGAWEGVAAAVAELLPPRSRSRRELTEGDIPRNAVLVVSVHLDEAEYGPATRDCLHDARARTVIRNGVARDLFAAGAPTGSDAPWRVLAAVRDRRPWVDVLASDLERSSLVPVCDRYLHRDGEP